ncbi:hypothetical protein [uncultured Pedobacter sp.]|uniref:hypothetical protein n=1 Tax=uncultured Pedobacter sp. TaxID=246139 RepID=UPI0025D3D172|nr:hypothetical protein [uncultured Pedobacter sp.]
MDAESEVTTLILNGDFTNNCNLYRNYHKQFIRDGMVNAGAFAFEGGMSVDWDKYTSPDECIIRVGLTYKTGKTDFKNHSDFELLSLNVKDIKMIEGVSSINFTPIPKNQEEIGKPYNVSHSDVWFVDPELRLKFTYIANKIEVNREYIDKKVDEIKRRNEAIASAKKID